MKQVKKLLLPLVFLFNLYVLFFQPGWLAILIFENPVFPLGTIVSWLSILLLPLLMDIFIPLKKEYLIEKRLKGFLRVMIISGIVWGIGSYILSGNWTFSFQNMGLFTVWIVYSAIIIFTSVGILVFWLLYKILKK